MDPKVLGWIIGIFVGIFACVILGTIYFEEARGECNRLKEAFYRMEYHGKILKKFHSNNHHYPSVMFEDSSTRSLIFDYNDWAKILPGDILLKKKNESNFILIRRNDSIRFEQFIPDCEQFRE